MYSGMRNALRAHTIASFGLCTAAKSAECCGSEHSFIIGNRRFVHGIIMSMRLMMISVARSHRCLNRYLPKRRRERERESKKKIKHTGINANTLWVHRVQVKHSLYRLYVSFAFIAIAVRSFNLFVHRTKINRTYEERLTSCELWCPHFTYVNIFSILFIVLVHSFVWSKSNAVHNDDVDGVCAPRQPNYHIICSFDNFIDARACI